MPLTEALIPSLTAVILLKGTLLPFPTPQHHLFSLYIPKMLLFVFQVFPLAAPPAPSGN